MRKFSSKQPPASIRNFSSKQSQGGPNEEIPRKAVTRQPQWGNYQVSSRKAASMRKFSSKQLQGSLNEEILKYAVMRQPQWGNSQVSSHQLQKETSQVSSSNVAPMKKFSSKQPQGSLNEEILKQAVTRQPQWGNSQVSSYKAVSIRRIL